MNGGKSTELVTRTVLSLIRRHLLAVCGDGRSVERATRGGTGSGWYGRPQRASARPFRNFTARLRLESGRAIWLCDWKLA